MSAGTVWIIERYRNSQLEYFSDALVSGSRFEIVWSEKFDAAMKFADRDSAACFLAHACDGIGRVVEHSYMIGAGGVKVPAAA